MTTIECDCPFCPLVENNLNQCGIKVLFKWKKNGPLDACKILGIEDKELKNKLAHHLIKLCLFHRNNHGLKKGEKHHKETKDYEYFIESMTTGRGTKLYDAFEVCFHTKK